MNKRVQRSVITFILSIVAMITMALLGSKTTAQEAGGSELSLDNVTVTSFKIIDVTNGNGEIDYRTSDNAQFDEYNSDPTKFTNALDEGQKSSTYKLMLSIAYNSSEALKEGDILTIPATIGSGMNNFLPQTLKDNDSHELGTWEYKDGKVIIHFSGDYIKNNRITKFKASFETGDSTFHLNGGGQTLKLGERRIQEGQLGKEKLIVAREKQYVQGRKINDTNRTIYKAPDASDSEATWQLNIKSDTYYKQDEKRSYENPYLLEHNGAYSPKVYTDIYLEDTFTEVIKAPELIGLSVRISGTDDDGNVISGDYVVGLPKPLLREVKQGSHTKEELKTLLEKGEYAIYNNQDGTYTFMMKWWDMNDPAGSKYDDIPEIAAAGGVGDYLKENFPDIFGGMSPTTIEKINQIYAGKALQSLKEKIAVPYQV